MRTRVLKDHGINCVWYYVAKISDLAKTVTILKQWRSHKFKNRCLRPKHAIPAEFVTGAVIIRGMRYTLVRV